MRQDLRLSRDKIQRAYCSADMVSYNKDPSKMRSLSEKEGMRNTLKLFLLKW
jgi:hypothetical protein